MQLRPLLPVLGSPLRHRQGPLGALIAALAAALAFSLAATGQAATPAAIPASGQAHVIATITDLRSHKGQVLACLTRDPKAFPDCAKDPEGHHLIVPASGPVTLDFGALPPGRYAVSLVHDENANGKLDKALLVPREGYGFSRDAPVRMGPPRFDEAAFRLDSETLRIAIKMRYLL